MSQESMGSSEERYSRRRRKSFADNIRLNLHSLEVYYKEGRTARLLKTAHDEIFWTPEEWEFYQKRSRNFLKEKVGKGEGKAFKTGKRGELGCHVVCRSNNLAAICITSRKDGTEMPFLDDWITRTTLMAEGKLLARVLDNCLKKMPAELWAQEPRVMVDNGRMKYYEGRLNELVMEEIDVFRGRRSRTPSHMVPYEGAREVTHVYPVQRSRVVSESSVHDQARPPPSMPIPIQKQRTQSLPRPEKKKPTPEKEEKVKSSSGLRGLVQINIWKNQNQRSQSHPDLKMDKKLQAKMEQVETWNNHQERSQSLPRLEKALDMEQQMAAQRSMSPNELDMTGFTSSHSGDMNETLPIPGENHAVQYQGLSPSPPDLNTSYLSRRDHADQVRDIIRRDPNLSLSENGNHNRSFSPQSFKIMDQTTSSGFDDIQILDQQNSQDSPQMKKDMRLSPYYDEFSHEHIVQRQILTRGQGQDQPTQHHHERMEQRYYRSSQPGQQQRTQLQQDWHQYQQELREQQMQQQHQLQQQQLLQQQQKQQQLLQQQMVQQLRQHQQQQDWQQQQQQQQHQLGNHPLMHQQVLPQPHFDQQPMPQQQQQYDQQLVPQHQSPQQLLPEQFIQQQKQTSPTGEYRNQKAPAAAIYIFC